MDPERALEEILALESSSDSDQLSLPPPNTLDCEAYDSDDLVPIGLDGAEVEREEPAPEVDYSRPLSEMEVPVSISAEVSHI